MDRTWENIYLLYENYLRVDIVSAEEWSKEEYANYLATHYFLSSSTIRLSVCLKTASRRRRGVAGHFVSTAFQAESQTPSRQDYDASLPCPPRRKILSRPPTTWKDQLVPEGTKKPTVYPVPLRGPRYRRQTTDSRMDGKMASQIMDPHESGHDTGRNSIQFVRTALRHERLRTVQEHGFAFPLLSSLDGSKVWSAIFFFVSFLR